MRGTVETWVNSQWKYLAEPGQLSVEINNYNPLQRPRRQEFAGTLMENGAFYLTRRSVLESHRCRLGGKIGVFEMPEATAVEIDEPADWAMVEKLILNELIK
jgi:N-acylneuraminate cytidylyltransferase